MFQMFCGMPACGYLSPALREFPMLVRLACGLSQDHRSHTLVSGNARNLFKGERMQAQIVLNFEARLRVAVPQLVVSGK